ncbi:serine hydrolase domain-containing protein [Mariniluteicoccus endophyticus]
MLRVLTTQTRHLLDLDLARTQADLRLPSVSAGVVRGGLLAWQGSVGTVDGRAYGPPAGPTTQYRMGSITKSFIAVCVMRLRDVGRLDLSDRFGDHVTGTGIGDVTVAQLLSHNGGVRAETPAPWWERSPGVDWETLATEVTPRLRAGRGHHYSNVAYAALGRLLEQVHDARWFDVVLDELLTPLGMTCTTERPQAGAAHGLAVHPFADVLLAEPEHDAGAMAPAGQLWTTVSDLARWAAFLGGDTGGLLAAGTLAEMLEPLAVTDVPGQPWTAAHGLGWQLFNDAGRRSAGHGGSMPGFIAGLRTDLGTGDGVVVLTNSTSAVLQPLVDQVLDRLDAEPVAPTPWSAAGSVDDLELTGPWHWGPSVSSGRMEGELFVLGEPGQGRGASFRRTGPDSWVGLDGYYRGEPLQVVRRADGSISHLDIASFCFTRTPYADDVELPGGYAGWR